MRAWLCVGVCACLASLVGCGGDSRGSLIENTTNQMSSLASSLGSIKDKVTDFVKNKKAGKDEDAAKDLVAAKSAAEQIEQTAKQWQTAITRLASSPAATPEEKADFIKKNQGRIDQIRTQLIEAHVEMKKVVADANKEYEESMRPLMQALSKAEGEFAVVVRKK